MLDTGDDDDLAEQLRELKRRSGRSYEALARRLGVSRSALHRYVSGEGTPSRFTLLERFAVECGASRAELAELQRRWTRQVMTRSERVDDTGPDGPGAEVGVDAEADAAGLPGARPDDAHAPIARDTAPPERRRPARAATRRLRWAVVPTAVVAAAAVLYAAVAFGDDGDGRPVVLPSRPAPEDCVERTGVSHSDQYLGHTEWTTDHLCPNDVGESLYLTPSSSRKIGIMDTPRSWFICWLPGRVQGDSGRIWYYTRGDRSEPGAHRYGGWGFMASENVRATKHPWPEMPRCTFRPGLLEAREAGANSAAG